jgi:hypothetical protein
MAMSVWLTTRAKKNIYLANKERKEGMKEGRKEAIQQRKKERDRKGGSGQGASNTPKKKGK